MNDRYLFKAKRIDNGEWIVGNLIQTPFMGAVRSWISSEKADKERLRSVATYKTEWRAIEVRTDSVCQCTGLKDKNGTLIWENDVIKESSCGYVGLVKYKDCEYLIDWSDFPYIRRDIKFWIEERELRVIGNIFDNPELLEVKW